VTVRGHPAGRTRPGAGAVVAIGSIISVAFMGSVIVTPLYSLYQAKFGFSEIVLTLVYAVYVVGNVAALLLFGQVSDQLGRKPVALPGLALAGASAVAFLLAQSTAWLFAGRLLIGLAVGILSGTGTAWLAERFGPEHRSTATVSAATANMIGIAVGPLIAGLLAQYVTGPLRLVFLAYLALLAIVAVAIWHADDPRPRRIDSLRQLRVRPRIGVPADRLRAFAAPAITGFVTFALGGLYFSLIPGIVIRDLHERNLAVGGLVVCELAALAAVLIVVGRGLRPATAMVTGLLSLVPAVTLIVTAQAAHSMPLLLIATAFGAVAMSLGYRGSLQVVNQIAPDDRRAEVVSSYLIVCFIGNSVPVIGIGLLSTATSRLTASIVFACMVAALAMAALASRRFDRVPAGA
jgi:MFS family permease